MKINIDNVPKTSVVEISMLSNVDAIKFTYIWYKLWDKSKILFLAITLAKKWVIYCA